MKKPDEVIGNLSTHEEKQVTEIVRRAEKTLAHETEVTFNVSETRGAIPERVWDRVLTQANAAGWRADLQGPIVTIRRPSEGNRKAP
jgi:hypothetical protein